MRINIEEPNTAIMIVDDMALVYDVSTRALSVYSKATLAKDWYRFYGSCIDVEDASNTYFVRMLSSLAKDVVSGTYTEKQYDTIVKYIQPIFGINTTAKHSQSTGDYRLGIIEIVPCSCGCEDAPSIYRSFASFEMNTQQYRCPQCKRATTMYDESACEYDLAVHWNLSMLYPIIMEEYNA